MYYEVYVYMRNRYPSYALLGGDFHPSQQCWDVNLRYGTHEFSNPHPESVKGLKNIILTPRVWKGLKTSIHIWIHSWLFRVFEMIFSCFRWLVMASHG